MRLGIVVSGGHRRGADPLRARELDRELVARARERVDAIVLYDGWTAADAWNPRALTYASFLAVEAGELELMVRGIPLSVLNPVELAEQLATVDHACAGRLSATVTPGGEHAAATYALDPSAAGARFEEALLILRRMWEARPFSGTGPHFDFPEVIPTLRPFRPGGPPLSLAIHDVASAPRAAEAGLGGHIVASDALNRAEMLARYLAAGGAGPTSTEVGFDGASAAQLARLQDDGFEQVDVRLRHPGDDPATVLRRLDDLAVRRTALAAA